jgi:hypothetical protein
MCQGDFQISVKCAFSLKTNSLGSLSSWLKIESLFLVVNRLNQYLTLFIMKFGPQVGEMSLKGHSAGFARNAAVGGSALEEHHQPGQSEKPQRSGFARGPNS